MARTPFLGQYVVATAAVNATATGGTFIIVTLPHAHKPQAKNWQNFGKHTPPSAEDRSPFAQGTRPEYGMEHWGL
jgi:hypothetical protein